MVVACVFVVILLTAVSRLPSGKTRRLERHELKRIRRFSDERRREESLPFV